MAVQLQPRYDACIDDPQASALEQWRLLCDGAIMPTTNSLAIDSAAHVVQLALTPIFLLTGIASLLNVFSTRLGRIADQVDKLDEADNPSPRRLARLRLRSRALDLAVLLAAIAGALTCAAALALFVGEIKAAVAGRVLFGLFGGALVCSVAALGAFSFEMVLAGRSVRDDTKTVGK